MIGVAHAAGKRNIVFTTTGKPPIVGPDLTGTDVWLRIDHDAVGLARAAYSTDGQTFASLGEPYQMKWANYRGARLGLYTFNDDADAGHIDIDRFTYDYPGPGKE